MYSYKKHKLTVHIFSWIAIFNCPLKFWSMSRPFVLKYYITVKVTYSTHFTNFKLTLLLIQLYFLVSVVWCLSGPREQVDTRPYKKADGPASFCIPWWHDVKYMLRKVYQFMIYIWRDPSYIPSRAEESSMTSDSISWLIRIM